MKKIEATFSNISFDKEIEDPSKITAVFKMESGKVKNYVCQHIPGKGYVFQCLEDNGGLNGYHYDIERLIWDALKPVGVPRLNIEVFIAE